MSERERMVVDPTIETPSRDGRVTSADIGIGTVVMLSRELGRAGRGWAIVGEGNASAVAGDGFFAVTASGARLADASPSTVVRLELHAVLDAIRAEIVDDASWWDALLKSRHPDDLARPSVEAPVHAVCLAAGARVVAHSHPPAVNAILCSSEPELLVRGSLFPDQIVVCGGAWLYLPYLDPGRHLAAAVDRSLEQHRTAHGDLPRVVLLQNHGLIALGESANQVIEITEMAEKVASVLIGAASVGRPRFLGDTDVRRIASRADEAHRQEVMRLRDRQHS